MAKLLLYTEPMAQKTQVSYGIRWEGSTACLTRVTRYGSEVIYRGSKTNPRTGCNSLTDARAASKRVRA